MAKAQKKPKLIPPDLDKCQVMKYNPFILGGSCYYQCDSRPDYIVYETTPQDDGQIGSQSCCKSCREEYKDQMTVGYRWERIKRTKG